MKKVAVTLGFLISLSQFGLAENIDGTLAVDAENTLTKTKKSAAEVGTTIGNGINNTVDSVNTTVNSATSTLNEYEVNAKDSVAADSVPLSTGYGYSGSSYLEGPFVGLETSGVLASEADGKSGSGMSLGLRFGAQNIEWRTMAVLERFSADEEYNNYLRGLLQFDYYFLGADNLMVDTFAIRPYAGVNAGGLSLDTQTDNIKTLTYGGQFGATMNVTNQIDLDVGYRYNLATSDLIDHTSNISVGLHYKY